MHFIKIYWYKDFKTSLYRHGKVLKKIF